MYKNKEKLNTKYLEFLEEVINRSNSNSFSIKVATFSITGVILSMNSKIENCRIIIGVLIFIIILWYLDSQYLLIERKFRILFNMYIKDGKECYNFNIGFFNLQDKGLNVNEFRKLNVKYKCKKNNLQLYLRNMMDIIKTMFSRTIFPLYFCLLIIVILVYKLFLKI